MNNVFDFIGAGVPPQIWSVVVLAFLIAFLTLAIVFARNIYISYIQERFINKLEWSLINVRLPREVLRSPEAMELVLNSMHQGGGIATWYHRLVKGAVLLWFSLEIVSIEGNIYFFIHIPKKFKDLVESQIYAQYPQAEISEVEDYVKGIPLFTPEGDWNVFGGEFVLTKDDPYPIKTYIDYGLDKAVGKKEEEKIDPLTLQLEYMGSIGPGEQIWTQILVRKAGKRFKDPSSRFGFKKRDWISEGKDLSKKLLEDYGVENSEGKDMGRMTAAQKFTLEAVERSINKIGFDCGVRSIYIAKKDVFNYSRLPGLFGMYRPYGSTYLNGF